MAGSPGVHAVFFWGSKRPKGRDRLLNPPVQFLKVITRLTDEESTGKWQDSQEWVPFGICPQFPSVKLSGERGSEMALCSETQRWLVKTLANFKSDAASFFAPAD